MRGDGATERELANRIARTAGHVQIAALVDGESSRTCQAARVHGPLAAVSPGQLAHRIIAGVGNIHIAARIYCQTIGSADA